jgi:hypothetical protein
MGQALLANDRIPARHCDTPKVEKQSEPLDMLPRASVPKKPLCGNDAYINYQKNILYLHDAGRYTK